MAERNTAKVKRQETRKGGRKSASKAVPVKATTAAANAVDDVELANENQRLKAELAAARECIADLELKHTDVSNRIAWVIDSLHNLDD